MDQWKHGLWAHAPSRDARPVHIPPVHMARRPSVAGKQNPEQNPSVFPLRNDVFSLRPAADAPGPDGRGDPRPVAACGCGRQVEPSPSGAVSFCRIAACPVPLPPSPKSLAPRLQLLLITTSTAAINSRAAFHVRAHVLAFRSPRGGRCPSGSTAGEVAVGGRWRHHGTGQGTELLLR